MQRRERAIRDMQFSGSGELLIHETGYPMCPGEWSGDQGSSGVGALSEGTRYSPWNPLREYIWKPWDSTRLFRRSTPWPPLIAGVFLHHVLSSPSLWDLLGLLGRPLASWGFLKFSFVLEFLILSCLSMFLPHWLSFPFHSSSCGYHYTIFSCYFQGPAGRRWEGSLLLLTVACLFGWWSSWRGRGRGRGSAEAAPRRPNSHSSQAILGASGSQHLTQMCAPWEAACVHGPTSSFTPPHPHPGPGQRN